MATHTHTHTGHSRGEQGMREGEELSQVGNPGHYHWIRNGTKKSTSD